MKVLYEAEVTSSGGREGRIKSSDGILDMRVAVPKSMGGPGGETNPEQLFAGGYAACFESALLFVARSRKMNVGTTHVTAKVGIGPKEGGGFQLAVKLTVKLPDVPTTQAQELADAAHQVCPYSNATRGNIDVKIELG